MEEQNRDSWTYDELSRAVAEADWSMSKIGEDGQGVTLIFRKHHPAGDSGTETREVRGADEADAMRQFLAELDREESEGYEE